MKSRQEAINALKQVFNTANNRDSYDSEVIAKQVKSYLEELGADLEWKTSTQLKVN